MGIGAKRGAMGGECVTWLAEHRIDGKVVARFGRRGDEIVAEFSDLGTFAANQAGSSAHFDPLPRANPILVEKLDVSKLDALIRHLQGNLTLHGGAVALGDKAVALLGASRSGKSTTVAALCADRGAELVSDDTVAFELRQKGDASGPLQIVPTQTLAWLLPDARKALGLDVVGPYKTSVALPVTRAE